MGATYRQSQFWFRLSLFIGLPIFAWMMTAEAQFTNPVTRVEYLSTSSLQSTSSLPFFSSSKWVPTGAQQRPVRLKCHPRSLEDIYLAHRGSEIEKLEVLYNYFQRCKKELLKGNPKGIQALLKIEGVKYNFFENLHFQAVRFHFRDGTVHRGFTIIKPGPSRPLVLSVCGFSCEAGNTASPRFLVSHFSDQSPFHLVVLASQTSADNARENHRFTFGGYYEAQIAIEVGKWIRSSAPFQGSVTEVLFAGISLGGNTALFVSKYNDQNLMSDGSKVVAGVFAYCPAVNLKPTIDHLLKRDNLVKWVFYKELWNTLKKAYNDVPALKESIKPDELLSSNPPSKRRLLNILEMAAIDFHKRRPANANLHPFKDEVVNQADKLWAFNQFTQHSDSIETPTMVFSAKNDPVINFNSNGKILSDKYPAPTKENNLMIFNTSRGSHCAHSVSHGWEFMATIARMFLQDHSSLTRKKREIPFKLKGLKRLPRGHRHMLQEWTAIENKAQFKVKFTIYNNNNWDCSGPVDGKDSITCYYTRTLRVPYKDLPMPLKIPKTKTEAEIQSRWANAYLELHGSSQRLTNSGEALSKLVYVMYENKMKEQIFY